MTFSSTLQLRILGDHSLDKKLASPRVFSDGDGDNDADLKLRCSISSEGRWPSLKREDVLLDGTQTSTGATDSSLSAAATNNVGSLPSGLQGGGLSGPLTIPVSEGGVGCGASVHSDWNVISSNSFDETYLENEYASGGMALGSSSTAASLNHLNEPMHKLALENDDHDLPVISMPYPGTSWFLGNKAESGSTNGFALPSLGGVTPRSQAFSTPATASSAVFSVSSCAPSFHSSGVDYSTTAAKLPADRVPCPSDASSPGQMESVTPCLPHTLEPSELLFEDMNTWNGAPAPNGCLYFDSTPTTTSSTMSTPLHEYAPSYHHNQLPSSSSSAASSLYRLMQTPEEAFPTDAHWSANQVQHHYSTPSTANMTPTDAVKPMGCRMDGNDHGNQQSLRAAEEGQAIKRILRSSTLSQRVNTRLHSASPAPNAYNSMVGKPMPLPATNPVPPNQSAKIQLLTALNDCYWKNGRKNLQCFPSCPEHHDFYSMKMNNRKHSSVGVCRGPVYCHAFTNAAEFLPAVTTQQMKHEHGMGVPCGGSNAREVFVLGRFERVPQQESTNLLEELHAPPSFPSAAVFEQFRFTCFQAVEMEERRVLLPEASCGSSTEASDSSKSGESPNSKKRFIRSTWFFLPDVWKVQPMLKKKRKATRSAPAQTFPFCFRIFIYTRNLDGPGYSCIADTASSFFELYSTRTVDRVKRKYWSGEGSLSGQRVAKHRGLKRL